MKRSRIEMIAVAALVATALTSRPARATEHLWEFNEIFSNHDGTIQFIEMHNLFSDDQHNQSEAFFSTASGNEFHFPHDLSFFTSDRTFLAATAGFAALDGAPTPDFILPDNFFALDGDVVFYNAPRFFTVVSLEYGPGELPLDGLRSLIFDGSTALNSPMNFSGVEATIDASVPEPVSAVVFGAIGLALIARRNRTHRVTR